MRVLPDFDLYALNDENDEMDLFFISYVFER